MEYDYIEQGDCLKLMKEIPDKSIDLVLCDLPYGITQCKWDSPIDLNLLWGEYHRIIKDNCAIVLFATQPFTSILGASNIKELKYQWYWIKNQTSGFLNAKKQPLRHIEDILVFYNKQCKYYPQGLIDCNIKHSNKAMHRTADFNLGDDAQSSCIGGGFTHDEFIQSKTGYPKQSLYFGRDKSCGHPTQKPVALLEYLIKTYTLEGDVILDNCMGSGSTCVAAVNTNRHYIGFELEKKYFNIACKRLDEAEI